MGRYRLLATLLAAGDADDEEEAQYQSKMVLNCAIASAGLMMSHNALVLGSKSMRFRTYYTRAHMAKYGECAWARILHSAQHRDMGFLRTTGLDCQSFFSLLESFSPVIKALWDSRKTNPNQRRGRKKLLQPVDVLGIALCYCKSACECDSLRLKFALPPSTFSRYLNDGMACLKVTLEDLPAASITWPTEEEMKESSLLMKERLPLMEGCFAFADGLSLPVQEPGNRLKQNAYYNGYKCEFTTCMVAREIALIVAVTVSCLACSDCFMLCRFLSGCQPDCIQL